MASGWEGRARSARKGGSVGSPFPPPQIGEVVGEVVLAHDHPSIDSRGERSRRDLDDLDDLDDLAHSPVSLSSPSIGSSTIRPTLDGVRSAPHRGRALAAPPAHGGLDRVSAKSGARYEPIGSWLLAVPAHTSTCPRACVSRGGHVRPTCHVSTIRHARARADDPRRLESLVSTCAAPGSWHSRGVRRSAD
jgi:hypothetical protein